MRFCILLYPKKKTFLFLIEKKESAAGTQVSELTAPPLPVVAQKIVVAMRVPSLSGITSLIKNNSSFPSSHALASSQMIRVSRAIKSTLSDGGSSSSTNLKTSPISDSSRNSTSFKIQTFQRVKQDGKLVRLQSRAKEARAIAQLIRLSDSPSTAEALQTRLRELDKELTNPTTILVTDDPTELQGLLSQSRSMEEFCVNFSSAWPKRYKLHDVIFKHSSSRVDVDTRHQDAKDIERDAMIVGDHAGAVLFGANIGYDGAINAIAAEIAELCETERSDRSAILKFARLLLNASNRTTSGGDAFEAIERFVKPGHLVFIAPDSTAPLAPLRISCRLDTFKTVDGWDWGVCGRTEASTRYLIYELNDVDRLNPIARIEGKCIREFGMPLPLPSYDDPRIFRDDGRSIFARSFFECDDGGILELSGTVLSLKTIEGSMDNDSGNDLR